MAIISNSISEAAALLKQGKLVAIPTETVYGLAGNAFDSQAVLEIFCVKKRPHFNPLIVHTHNLEAVKSFVLDIPSPLKKLAENFWPGPLTLLLLRDGAKIHDLVTAGNDQVAVRVPNHSVCLELLRSLDFPLAAPSANPFGYISPTSAKHVQDQLGDAIPMILEGGSSQVGVESTIVGMGENEKVQIFRYGGIGAEDLKAVLSYMPEVHSQKGKTLAPGMLKSHYAPAKKLVFGDAKSLIEIFKGKKMAILCFTAKHEGVEDNNQLVLSPSGSLEQAAQHLFSHLRILDDLTVEIIIAEKVPDVGLGKAINDRLRRAAAER